jgi:hypothetical protein
MTGPAEQNKAIVEREIKRVFPEETALFGDDILDLFIGGTRRSFNSGPWLEAAEKVFRAAEFTLLVINVVLHAREAQAKGSKANLVQELAEVKTTFPDLPPGKLDQIVEGIESDPSLNRPDPSSEDSKRV